MLQPHYDPDWPPSWRKSYHYDRLEVYDEPSTDHGYVYAYQRRREQTLAAISRHVPPDSRILDVAAAQGNFTLALAEMGYEVTWNDLRAELADYVRLKHESGIVRYLPGDVFSLPMSESFDAVVITEVIEHVAHPDAFLVRVARLVRPGGVVIMTTPNGGYFRNRLPKFSECPDPSRYESVQFRPDSDGHIFLLHLDELPVLSRAAGLDLLETRTFTNPLTNGHLRTGRLLPFLPRLVVNVIESITGVAGGIPLQRLNTALLAVLRRPPIR